MRNWQHSVHNAQDEDKQSINNVNEIRALLQIARGKNEQNIVFIWKSKRTYQNGPQNTKTHNRTVHKVKI